MSLPQIFSILSGVSGPTDRCVVVHSVVSHLNLYYRTPTPCHRVPFSLFPHDIDQATCFLVSWLFLDVSDDFLRVSFNLYLCPLYFGNGVLESWLDSGYVDLARMFLGWCRQLHIGAHEETWFSFCEWASLFTWLSGIFAVSTEVFFPSWLVDNLWDDIFTRPVPQQHPPWV